MGLKNRKQIEYFIFEFQSKYPSIQNAESFFVSNLSKMAKVREIEDLHNKATDFIEEYKKHFSGSNGLYGFLYHSFIKFMASVNDIDEMVIYSEINKK